MVFVVLSLRLAKAPLGTSMPGIGCDSRVSERGSGIIQLTKSYFQNFFIRGEEYVRKPV